jgi:glycosyltransferase involved in cell wall biosynthesis
MQTQNFYCIIAGDEQGREAYLAYLKKLAEKYGLSSRICFHGKVLDMPALMSVSSVIVSAAIEPEAFGRIAIEGQAMGRVVVASDIGGSKETVIDGVTGKLFKSGDADDLANAIGWALSLSKEDKDKIGANAIKNVKEHFTKQIMCDKTIEVYNEVMNQSNEN